MTDRQYELPNYYGGGRDEGLMQGHKESSLSFHQNPSEYQQFTPLENPTFFEKLEQKHEGKIGYYYMLVSVVCMSLNALFAKLLDEIPSFEILFFRSLMVILLLFAHTKWVDPELEIDDKRNKKVIIWLSGLAAVAAACFIYGISKMSLAGAVVLIYTAPMFTGLMSFFILKTKVDKFEILAAICAFVGVLFVIRPDFDSSDDADGETHKNSARLAGGIACLLHALLLSLTQVIIRSVGPKVNPLTIVTFTNVFAAIGSPILMIIQGWETPGFGSLFQILLMAVCYFFGQFFLTKSCQHTEKIFNVTLMNYLQVPFAFIYDLWIINESLIGYTIIGTLIIVASCLFILKRQNA